MTLTVLSTVTYPESPLQLSAPLRRAPAMSMTFFTNKHAIVTMQVSKMPVKCKHCHQPFKNLRTFRPHHIICAAAKDMDCRDNRGCACDTCCSENEPVPTVHQEEDGTAFEPRRVAQSVISAAKNDEHLPSAFERKYQFAAKGKNMYPNPVFNDQDVQTELASALSWMELFNSLATTSVLHNLQGVMINSMGTQKRRPYMQHQEATVKEYARTLAAFLAFLYATGVSFQEAVEEPLVGNRECTVTRFLLHECQHNTQ